MSRKTHSNSWRSSCSILQIQNLKQGEDRDRGGDVVGALNDARGEDGDVSFLILLGSCGGVGVDLDPWRCAAERQRSAPKACVACWRRWLGFHSLNRHYGGRLRESMKLGAEYAHQAFTNVVPFE
jgi:hypothetical protein